MLTIIKFITRSILEKKLRTLLILSVIMLSSAMYFASVSLSGTLVKMQLDNWRQSYGYTDIIIHRSTSSPSPYFYMNDAQQFSAGMMYIIGEISGYATYINNDHTRYGTMLKGIDINDLQKLTPFVLRDERGLYPFNGMKAVISTVTAEKFGLQTGDTIELDIGGALHKFLICGIVYPSGPFLNETGVITAVIPEKTLNSLYNVRGRVDMIYLKLRNQEMKQRYLYLISREYSRYTVEEPFNEWEVKRETDRIATPVIIVTVILSFMCIYIIYTTYKIIILERMPVIGTFRSIGATRRATNAVLILESLFYGFFGGLSGCGFGILLLTLISSLASANGNTKAVTASISPFQLATTLAIAILLAVIGSIIPIIRTVKLPVRYIMSGTIKEKDTNYRNNLIPGIILILLSLSIPHLIPATQALIADTLCIMGILLAAGLLIPYIMDKMMGLPGKMNITPFGNMGFLAVNNLSRNHNAQNNVSMLVIGLSSLYMISTLNFSQITDIDKSFDKSLYDMTMEMKYIDKATLTLISQSTDVKDVMGSYYAERTKVEGYDDPIWHILSINSKFPDFFNLSISSGKNALSELDKSRSILLTYTLKERMNVKTGDYITLKLSVGNGGNAYCKYMIAGFFNTIHLGQWSYALISEKYFKQDFRKAYFGKLYIKAKDNPVGTLDNLKTAFARRKPEIILKEEEKNVAIQSNRQLFVILQGFTVLTMITGSYGILNNFIISFMQRRRQIAMLRSIGMNRLQLYKMIFIEALMQGTLGSILGIASGITTTWFIVPRIIKALSIESTLYFSPLLTIACFSVGIAAIMLSAIEPVIRSSKLDMVTAVKY